MGELTELKWQSLLAGSAIYHSKEMRPDGKQKVTVEIAEVRRGDWEGQLFKTLSCNCIRALLGDPCKHVLASYDCTHLSDSQYDDDKDNNVFTSLLEINPSEPVLLQLGIHRLTIPVFFDYEAGIYTGRISVLRDGVKVSLGMLETFSRHDMMVNLHSAVADTLAEARRLADVLIEAADNPADYSNTDNAADLFRCTANFHVDAPVHRRGELWGSHDTTKVADNYLRFATGTCLRCFIDTSQFYDRILY